MHLALFPHFGELCLLFLQLRLKLLFPLANQVQLMSIAPLSAHHSAVALTVSSSVRLIIG